MQNTPSLLYSQSEENQHKVGQHLRLRILQHFYSLFSRSNGISPTAKNHLLYERYIRKSWIETQTTTI
jgi:hypothetical protein